MRFIFQILSGAALVAATILVLSAERKKNIKTTSHEYYYYPLANVYYDSAQKQFTFYDPRQNSWKSRSSLPVTKELGQNVFIPDHGEAVWKNNAEHKMIYSVKIYSEPIDIKAEKAKASLKPVPEQKLPLVVMEEKKKKKGIRGFLRRIW